MNNPQRSEAHMMNRGGPMNSPKLPPPSTDLADLAGQVNEWAAAWDENVQVSIGEASGIDEAIIKGLMNNLDNSFEIARLNVVDIYHGGHLGIRLFIDRRFVEFQDDFPKTDAMDGLDDLISFLKFAGWETNEVNDND